MALVNFIFAPFFDLDPGRAGANWVDPPERKRKRLVNYNEGEFYRNAQKAAAGSKAPAGPRLAKMPQMQVPLCRVNPPTTGMTHYRGVLLFGLHSYVIVAEAWTCIFLQDFQFFNQGRLTEIYAKEAAYENFRWQQAQKKDAALKQVGSAAHRAATRPSQLSGPDC